MGRSSFSHESIIQTINLSTNQNQFCSSSTWAQEFSNNGLSRMLCPIPLPLSLLTPLFWLIKSISRSPLSLCTMAGTQGRCCRTCTARTRKVYFSHDKLCNLVLETLSDGNLVTIWSVRFLPCPLRMEFFVLFFNFSVTSNITEKPHHRGTASYWTVLVLPGLGSGACFSVGWAG